MMDMFQVGREGALALCKPARDQAYGVGQRQQNHPQRANRREGSALTLREIDGEPGERKSKQHAAGIELVFSPKIRLRLYLSVMIIALVTTHSRMGNTAFFSSLLIAGIIGLAMSRHATRSTVILLVSLIAIDVFIVGSWFGVEKLAQRLEQTTMQDVEERQDPSQFALQQIRDYPLFGSGAGSFYTVFPRYRGPQVVGYFDYAHDDYVQLAAENGVIGIFLLGAIVVVSLVAALRAQWRRRDPLMRGMAFSSIMGVTAILIHSTVDFNLQIPAQRHDVCGAARAGVDFAAPRPQAPRPPARLQWGEIKIV